jgi:hypothetical protein
MRLGLEKREEGGGVEVLRFYRREVDDIDLVPLNGASPVLGFEALCGRRVYCADENLCAEFASLTAREYEDEMAMCERWVAAGGGPGRA